MFHENFQSSPLPIFTISRAGEPIVTCGLGKGDDEVWDALVELQRTFADVVASTPNGPYLAVAILPGIARQARSDIEWIGDFERCMAAALHGPTHAFS